MLRCIPAALAALVLVTGALFPMMPMPAEAGVAAAIAVPVVCTPATR